MRFRDHLYRLKQECKSLFFYPPLRQERNYDAYWEARRMHKDRLDEPRRERADLAERYIDSHSTIMDIGCGNGTLLTQIHHKKQLARMVGVDISLDALALAKENGLETIQADIRAKSERETLPDVDYIFLFEVIEHVPDSEELLAWARRKAKKGVCFSVPNTGYWTHRIRLLLGRFPLQWRIHPSEHVRFWTLSDMRWWLGQLGVQSYHLHTYQGVPLLRKWWPSLFAQGLFVFIPNGNGPTRV